MAHRFVLMSVSFIGATAACSLVAPSDSEFLKAPGAAGTAGAGAAATDGKAGSAAAVSGTGATGGESGATVDAAVGAGGADATDEGGGGSSGSSADSGADTTGCVPQNTVDSCGPRCEKCTAPDDRTAPTCDGTACGVSCKNPALKCSDDSCSQLVWSFDSGSLAGIASDLPLAVRSFDGSPALALDVAQLNAVSYAAFTLPICAAGTVDLRAKTLSFRAYFQGIPQSTYELTLQAWVPVRPTNGAALGSTTAPTGAWIDFSAPLSKSAFSGNTTTVMIEVATTGVGFSGTIWFDDFRIQ